MKIVSIWLTLLLIALLAVGCTPQASSDKIAEDIIEKATGNDVEVSGDEVTIKGKDGSSIQVGDSLEWPKDKMGDLPVLNGAITGFIATGEEGGMLTVDGTNKEDALAYIETIKSLGYKMSYESEDDDGSLTFGGENGSFKVALHFFPEGGDEAGESQVTLSYTKIEQPKAEE